MSDQFPIAAVSLPLPRDMKKFSLDAALNQRRSIRDYAPGRHLSLEAVACLLRTAQGITSRRGFRAAPSAGALYPLEIYVAAGAVYGLSAGMYRYGPAAHSLVPVLAGDQRAALARAALGQAPVAEAPAVFVISAVFARTTGKYGDRGVRYVYLEAGHAAQNLCLTATALELGTVPIGAFHDSHIRELSGMGRDENPIYLIPAGYMDQP